MISLKLTPGISIVPAAAQHANALSSLVENDIEHFRTYLPNVAALASAQEATAHLEAAIDYAQKGEMYEWHLFTDATLCGAIRVRDIDHVDRKAQIGYYIGSQFQGRGIVTSSVRAVLAHCFETLDFNRVQLRCAASNKRSMRVAERLGFTHEGLLRQYEFLNGEFVDQHVYSMLRDEFVALNRPGEASC